MDITVFDTDVEWDKREALFLDGFSTIRISPVFRNMVRRDVGSITESGAPPPALFVLEGCAVTEETASAPKFGRGTA